MTWDIQEILSAIIKIAFYIFVSQFLMTPKYIIGIEVRKKLSITAYRGRSSKSELAKISELTNKWIKNSKNVHQVSSKLD